MLSPVALPDVRFTDERLLSAQGRNAEYLRYLDLDRLLYAYRLAAGLPTPGESSGGWEAPGSPDRGNFLGHYLSACAQTFAASGDELLRDRGVAAAAELAKCQDAIGTGYVQAQPAEKLDLLERGERLDWVGPYYAVHKLMAGLLDVHLLCGDERAADVLLGLVEYVRGRCDRLSDRELDAVLQREFGGMSEVLHNVYALTGDHAHLALAHRFDHASFLGPLALEHDNLAGLHANTQVPKILGAARHYELTGDPLYRAAVRFFWDLVAGPRTYATGGTSDDEHWRDPRKLTGTLGSKNQESCVTHNMLKVTRYLLRWTGHARYGDYHERAFWNSVVGTQHPGTGMFAYFLPLGPGGAKAYSTPYDSFWCCMGTGVEAFARLTDGIYFHGRDEVLVNMIVASEARIPMLGVALTQQTRFPEEAATRVVITTAPRSELTLRVRVPHWAQQPTLTVNGTAVAPCQPGTIAGVRRRWRAGDTLRLETPMSLRLEPLPDELDTAAIVFGPLVLAAQTPTTPMALAGVGDDVGAWVRQCGDGRLRFQADTASGILALRPLNQVVEEPYSVYWSVGAT